MSVFSYDGGLGFGVTGDYDQAPDIEVLCEGIERSMAELVDAAGGPVHGNRHPRPERGAAPTRASRRIRSAPACRMRRIR